MSIANPVTPQRSPNAGTTPDSVQGIPISEGMPNWRRKVLTESQAAVESSLFQWRKLIIAAPHLRPNSKLVALVVADRCGDKNECAWPSLATLEANTSLGRKSVVRAVRDLEVNGFLVVGRNRGQSNRYHPALPVVMEAENWLLENTPPGSPGHPTRVPVTPDQGRCDATTRVAVTPEVSIEVAMKSSEKCETSEIFANNGREDRAEVIEALAVLQREVPAALAGDGRQKARELLRTIRDPVTAACGFTRAHRECSSLNPVGRLLGYLAGCAKRDAA
jgi:hypothetical protein